MDLEAAVKGFRENIQVLKKIISVMNRRPGWHLTKRHIINGLSKECFNWRLFSQTIFTRLKIIAILIHSYTLTSLVILIHLYTHTPV